MGSTSVIDALASDASLLDFCDDAPPGFEALRCHPDLIDRLEELGRVLRAALVYVSGCPVLIDRISGMPFAAAWGTASFALRLGATHPGMLTMDPPHHEGLDLSWWNVDPWPQDTTFQRGNDILRHAVRQAMEALTSDH